MVLHGVNFDERRLAAFCRAHGIARLSLFGSILTDRFGPDSDVDLLVEFMPGTRVSLFTLGGLSTDLAALLGRQVDLRMPGELSDYFRDEVVQGARALYAA